MLIPTPRSSREVGRYAPSPTGRLHLGNLHTALVAYDDIRNRGGVFILRMEDTDFPRNVAGAEETIIADLKWLSIDWEEGPDIGGPAGPYSQSQRGSIYEDALRQLARANLIYPCTCSRKDIESDASAPHGTEGLIYPGTCRPGCASSTAEDTDTALTKFLTTPWQQRGACLRLRTDTLPPVAFTDEIHGEQNHDVAREYGDFVVLRRDGLWAYQFVCAVDDALMGITRVVRGSDLLSSTARQVAIIQALGFSAPVYRHVPLVLDTSGARMSKRDGSASIDTLSDLTPALAREKLKAMAGASY